MSGHTQGDPSTARRVMEAVPFGLWVTGAVSAIIVVTGMALTTVNRALSPVSSVIIAIVIALLLAGKQVNAWTLVSGTVWGAVAHLAVLLVAIRRAWRTYLESQLYKGVDSA